MLCCYICYLILNNVATVTINILFLARFWNIAFGCVHAMVFDQAEIWQNQWFLGVIGYVEDKLGVVCCVAILVINFEQDSDRHY